MLTLLPACSPPDPPSAPLDDLHRAVLEDARRLRIIQVRLARSLLALRRAPSLFRFGATTFPLYCETVGLSAGEGRDLASLAEAEMVRPDVVPRFTGGRLSLGKVAALAHLLRLPRQGPFLRPDPGSGDAGLHDTKPEDRDTEPEDWVRTAEGVTTRDLWRLLEEQRESRRLRDSPEFMAMFVSRRGRQDFLRCRDLVSRREWLPVTEGAALERVCDTFLAKNDPERRAARLAERDRRAARDRGSPATPPTVPAPSRPVPSRPAPDDDPRRRRRRIPAALRRDLIRLFGDRCWVEGCDRRCFLEFAHGIPVREGGGEEFDNLLRLCGEHHAQFDGEGWLLIPRRDGVVVLIDRRGVVVGRLRRAPEGNGPQEGTRQEGTRQEGTRQEGTRREGT